MELNPQQINYLAEKLHGHYEMCRFPGFTGRTPWRNIPEDERVKLRAQIEHVFGLIPDGLQIHISGGLTQTLAKSLHFFAYHQTVNLPTEQCLGEDDLDLDCEWGQGMARDRIRYLVQCFQECKLKGDQHGKQDSV